MLDDEPLPILQDEVEAAVEAIKIEKKSAGPGGVDNIPAESVKAGGDAMIDVMSSVCNKILKTGEW